MRQPVQRVRLTKGQQLALCKHAKDQTPQLSLQLLAEWAEEAFKLAKPPSTSTICRVLRQEPFLKMLGEEELSKARTVPPHIQALDAKVVEAILYFESGSIALSGRLIIWLAKHCAEELRIPKNLRPMFTRGGWLRHFMVRHGIRSRRAYGEIGSVDMKAARSGVEKLKPILAGYDPADVYNMDEAAFFYRSLAKRSLCVNRPPALKQKKERVTMVVAANATGSHKVPITILGKAAKPRWLARKPDGVKYSGSSKGWMSTEIFRRWLKSFDKQMAAADRHVLLLVDNASSHEPPEEALEHVRLEKLPPNTTAAIQPMDQGVIACIKNHIMDAKTEAVMQRFLAGDEDAHNIEMVEAIQWCKDAWDKVTPETIRNCWKHSGLIVQ
jgi:hypothetical protein